MTAMRVREVTNEAERARLWQLSVDVYPPYEDYQAKTTRQIPVFLAEPFDLRIDEKSVLIYLSGQASVNSNSSSGNCSVWITV